MCLAPAAMEMEELQEADVLWPDHDDHQDHCHCHCHCHQQQQLESAGNKQPQVGDAPRGRGDEARRRAAGGSSSAPVSIRAGTTTGHHRSYDNGDESASFVPPHVVLAARRRCSEGRAAACVCVGQGRTLKGRDLQSVRTAVLRMTGFLET